MIRTFDRLVAASVAFIGFAVVAVGDESGVLPTSHPPSGFVAVAFTPDGRRIVAAGPDRSLSLYELREGAINLVRTLVPPPVAKTRGDRVIVNYKDGYTAVALAPKHEVIAVADFMGHIELRSLEAGVITKLTGHKGKVNDVAYSPDGKRLASAGDDGKVRVWDVNPAENAAETRLLSGLEGKVLAVGWSTDGKLLAASDEHKSLIVWDAASLDERQRLSRGVAGGVKADQASLAFGPNGDCVATAYNNNDEQKSGAITIFYFATQLLPTPPTGIVKAIQLDPPILGIVSAGFAPGGDRFLTLSRNGLVHAWDLKDPLGNPNLTADPIINLKTLFPASAFLTSAFSPDGNVMVVGCMQLVKAKDSPADHPEPDAQGQLITISLQGTPLRFLNKLDKALWECNEAIRLNPGDSDKFTERGRVWAEMGHPNAALSDLNEAVRLGPANINALMARGWFWSGIRWNNKADLNKSITDFSSVIRLDPNNSAALQNRGDVWQRMGDSESALADYNEAIQHNSKMSMAFAARGRIWQLNGNLDKALTDLNEAIRVAPHNPVSFRLRAKLWTVKGEWEKALSDFSEAIHLDPKDAESFRGRADVWRKKGDTVHADADSAEAARMELMYRR